MARRPQFRHCPRNGKRGKANPQSLRGATREDLRHLPLRDLASPETGPRAECGFLRGGRTGAIIKSPCNNDFPLKGPRFIRSDP